MDTVLFKFWVNTTPHIRHSNPNSEPIFKKLTVKAVMAYEASGRTKPFFEFRASGNFSTDVQSYEIVEEESDGDWKDYFSVSDIDVDYDVQMLTISTKLKDANLGFDFPEIVQKD